MDYGTSIDVLTDLPVGRWTPATGLRNLVCSIFRRVSTDRGSLALHPDYGLNLVDLVGDSVTATSLRQAERQFAREVEREQRVAACSCAFSYSIATSTLTARFSVEAVGSGTFTLVLAADAVTVSLIEVG